MLYIKLLLMLVIYFVSESEAFNTDNEGVCVIRKSFKATRSKPYTIKINRKCGREKCIAKRWRIESYTTWKKQTACCTGWQYDSEQDSCVPVCSTGCKNGRCVAPDRCHCEPPFHQDPAHVNGCIPNVCNPPCFGAECWPNNTCKCLPNFQKYNATHCARCDDGYTINSELQCTPRCDQNCVNGTCVAPNTCKCLEGYRSKDSHTCEPVCDCVNGECVAPNVCSCRAGYTAVNASFCTPVCDNCENGDCTEPHNCVCHDGYIRIDGACKPACDKACVNGVCSAPNVCTCNEGYMKNGSKPEECFKPCAESCDGTCDHNGVCLKKICKSFITG